MALRTVETIAGLRTTLGSARAEGRTVGFVPTMGALHDGHLSLMRAARTTTDVVVASVFVNPLQFGADEDLGAYPRDLATDLAAAEGVGVDVVFAPSVAQMYPEGEVATTVTVGGLSEVLEGATRPGHFAGVATVVAKLFSIVGPCAAFFGEKDFQQLAVVRRMVSDLSMAVEVVGCPIVRDHDGLALSSRNVYLDADERAAAPVLYRALQAGAVAIDAGERDPGAVEATMAAVVAAVPRAELDYLSVVDADTLRTPPELRGELRVLGAIRLGRPRLIDNLGVTVDG